MRAATAMKAIVRKVYAAELQGIEMALAQIHWSMGQWPGALVMHAQESSSQIIRQRYGHVRPLEGPPVSISYAGFPN